MTVTAFDLNDPDHLLAYRIGHHHAQHDLSAAPMLGHQMRQLVGPVDVGAARTASLCCAFNAGHSRERDRLALRRLEPTADLEPDPHATTVELAPHQLRPDMMFQSRVLPGATAAFVYRAVSVAVEHPATQMVSVTVQGYPAVVFLSDRQPIAAYQDHS